MPLRLLAAEILRRDRRRQIDLIDIRQRAQPRQDISEFLFEIRPIRLAAQCRRQFPHLLDEPDERTGRPAPAVNA